MYFVVHVRMNITQILVFLIFYIYLCAESEHRTLTEESEDSKF